MQPIAGHNLALYRQLERAGWEAAELVKLHSVYKAAAVLSHPLARANWKPFLNHLVGTASVVAWDSNDPLVISTALIHSAIEFGAYPAFVIGREGKLKHLGRRVGSTLAAQIDRYDRANRRRPLEATDDEIAADPPMIHLRLANLLDDILDELGPVRTGKSMPELAAGPPALQRLAELSARVGAPHLAAAYEELAARQRAAGPIAESRAGSFRIDEISPGPFRRLAISIRKRVNRH